MLVTKHAIDYKAAPYGRIIVIPAGIPVLPATNLPARGEDPQYWVQEWEDMPNSAHSWLRNYGFLVDASDVCDTEDEGELIAVDSAGDELPMDVDGSGAGWPGDGSGEDDFADMNANEADDYRDE